MGLLLQVIWLLLLNLFVISVSGSSSPGFSVFVSQEPSSLEPGEAHAPNPVVKPSFPLGSSSQPPVGSPSTKSPVLQQSSAPSQPAHNSASLPHTLTPSPAGEFWRDSTPLPVVQPPLSAKPSGHSTLNPGAEPPLAAPAQVNDPPQSVTLPPSQKTRPESPLPPPVPPAYIIPSHVSTQPPFAVPVPANSPPSLLSPLPSTISPHTSALPLAAKPPEAPQPIAEPPHSVNVSAPPEKLPILDTPPPAGQLNVSSPPPAPSHALVPPTSLPSPPPSVSPHASPVNFSVSPPLTRPPIASSAPPPTELPDPLPPPSSPPHLIPRPSPPNNVPPPLTFVPPPIIVPIAEPPPSLPSLPPVTSPHASPVNFHISPPLASPPPVVSAPPPAELPDIVPLPSPPAVLSAPPPAELPDIVPPPSPPPILSAPPPADLPDVVPPPSPPLVLSAPPPAELPDIVPPPSPPPILSAPPPADLPDVVPPPSPPPVLSAPPPAELPDIVPPPTSTEPGKIPHNTPPPTSLGPPYGLSAPPPPPLELPHSVPPPTSPMPGAIPHDAPPPTILEPPPAFYAPPPTEFPHTVPPPSSTVPGRSPYYAPPPTILGPPGVSAPPPIELPHFVPPPTSTAPGEIPHNAPPPTLRPPPGLFAPPPIQLPHIAPPPTSTVPGNNPYYVPPPTILGLPLSTPPPTEVPHFVPPPMSTAPREIPHNAPPPTTLLAPPVGSPPLVVPSNASASQPPRMRPPHSLSTPPHSQERHSSAPPPSTSQQTVPAAPRHISPTNKTHLKAPPPVPSSSEASPSPRIAPIVAPPAHPGTQPPVSHQIEAPKPSAPFVRSNASAESPISSGNPLAAPPGGASSGISPSTNLSPPSGSFHDRAPPEPKLEGRNGPAPAPSSLQPHPRSHGSPMTAALSPPHSGTADISPAPSPILTAAHGHSTIPFLSPTISPSGPSTRNTKKPLAQPILALPPPPPNQDCAYLPCPEPLTITPPGTPCKCVWPMQVGLRLSVALYTFFPLVSQLADEIADGVFLKQSQVRIMGANAATQQPEKTIVLVDLIPLGDEFDNVTANLIFQRFWHMQISIDKNKFGDYDVLYVHYPGLPPSPPMAPADIAVINGMPYVVGDPNGSNMHPLGVDVSKQKHKRKLNRSLIAVIVISAIAGVFIFASVAWILIFKRTNNGSHPAQTPRAVPSLPRSLGRTGPSTGSGPSSPLSLGSSLAAYTGSAKTFSASEIEKATDNFNPSRIVGEGGFGLVYSGVLDDDSSVAVKVLKRDDQQGGREFLAEVEMLSRLHHRNLVKLIGICVDERMRCLVYELVPNGSVESHLHGDHRETAHLDWASRLKIALGSARGLAYLHEDSSPRVIHRDFKASNILLENDFTPKVSDFGLARAAMEEENRHISTRVMGTFGYVAPEYAMTGHLLVKSDVYSYGVVLLELLTGRKPVDMSQPSGQENLVTWTRPLLTSSEGLESIVDPSLGPDVPFDSVAKVAAIASMCVQPEVSHRPFMGEVVQALKLVCNECDDSKEDSRSCSRDNLSVDFDVKAEEPDPLQSRFSLHGYVSGYDVEKGLSVSDIFSKSARLGRQGSSSFRRHSSSGPMSTSKGPHFWQKIRRLSQGSVSEHGIMYRLWAGSQ